jgi:hypothetical protein
MVSELDVPVIVPSEGSNIRATPSLGRVLLGGVPRLQRYYESLRLPSPPRCCPFGRAAVPDADRAVRSLPRHGRRIREGPGYLRLARMPLFVRGVRASQVPGDPRCARAQVSDPGQASAPRQCRCFGAAAPSQKEGGPVEQKLSRLNTALSHSLSTLRRAVFAAPRKTRFRLLARHCRADGPAGIRFKVSSADSSLTRLGLTHSASSALSRDVRTTSVCRGSVVSRLTRRPRSGRRCRGPET